MTPNFVLIDYVYSPSEGRLEMYSFPQLVELVLFEARTQKLVLIFDAALDLFDEIGLFELDFRTGCSLHHLGS